MEKKEISTALKRVIFVLKSILKIVIYIALVLLIINLCKGAFSFGYAVLNQEPMTEEQGVDVTVEIPVGADARDIGKILEKNGLIEDWKVFILQELLSNYHDKLQSGTYVLNTSQTPDEMIIIMGGGVMEEE